jgi:hypothetical protein
LLTQQEFVANIGLISSVFIQCDNAGENMSNALKTWPTDNGILSESSTPFELWQNSWAEVQSHILCNIARTNMIASG